MPPLSINDKRDGEPELALIDMPVNVAVQEE
jgi:hypothetical protein